MAFLLLWIFTFYDLFWVFLSSYFFGKGVMEDVAVGLSNSEESLPIPILYRVPHVFSDGEQLMGLFCSLRPSKPFNSVSLSLSVSLWRIWPQGSVMWCCQEYIWLFSTDWMIPFIGNALNRPPCCCDNGGGLQRRYILALDCQATLWLCTRAFSSSYCSTPASLL